MYYTSPTKLALRNSEHLFKPGHEHSQQSTSTTQVHSFYANTRVQTASNSFLRRYGACFTEEAEYVQILAPASAYRTRYKSRSNSLFLYDGTRHIRPAIQSGTSHTSEEPSGYITHYTLTESRRSHAGVYIPC